MEVPGCHARTRGITRDTLFPANRAVGIGGGMSRDVARVVSDVSVLCPRAVHSFDNKAAWGLGAPYCTNLETSRRPAPSTPERSPPRASSRLLRPFFPPDPVVVHRWSLGSAVHRARSARRTKSSPGAVRGRPQGWRAEGQGGGGRKRHRLGEPFRAVSLAQLEGPGLLRQSSIRQPMMTVRWRKVGPSPESATGGRCGRVPR
jgi:hypothetical protein